MEIEVKNLVLMYLNGFEEFKKEDDVPYGLTARGITKTLGVTDSKFSSALESLKDKDLVVEKERNVIGTDRKRNVYFLSEKGTKKEKEVWGEIKNEHVTLIVEGNQKELQLKDLKNHVSGRNPIIKGLRYMDDKGTIDLSKTEEGTEVFVGRKKEQEKLKELLKKVKDQGSEIIFIEGEAGIGKTSLISKLMPYAREFGFEFLTGTCQSETSDPYLPFKEAFSEYLEKKKKEEEEPTSMAFIGKKDETEIEEKRLFDAKKEETFYETTKYVRQLAQETPLVIFLDDLQWVDKATLDILAYMDDKLEEVPVFFIGAYRPEDVDEDHHLVEMMHRLDRKRKYEKIELDPLSISDTRETLIGILGSKEIPEHFVTNIHDKTEGNPLFIKESVRQMLDEGIVDPEDGKFPKKEDDLSISDMVHNVIERRINRLDEETIKVIQVGSVIGKVVPFDLLSNTTKMDEIDLLDNIDMLIGNQLWEEKPDEEVFYFSHPLIQETVYGKVKRLKKKLLHKKVAQAIESTYENEIDEWYSDLGRHYEKAGSSSEAVNYYLKAGDKAEEVYANDDAIEMYEKALNLSEEVENEDLDKIELFEKLSRAYSFLGVYDQAKDSLNSALEKVRSGKGKQRIYRKLAKIYREEGDFDKSLEQSNKGLDVETEANEEECKLLHVKGWALMRLGDYDKALEVFEREQNISEKTDQKSARGQALHDLGSVHLLRGDYGEVEGYLEKAIEIREKLDDNMGLSESKNNLAELYRFRGKLDEALEYYEESYELVEEMGNKWSASISASNIGLVYKEKGDLEKALEYYENSLKMSEEIGSKHNVSFILNNIGEVHLEKENYEKALDYYNRNLKITKEIGEEKGRIKGLCGISEVRIKMEDIERAEEFAEKALQLSTDLGGKLEEGLSRRILGEVYKHKREWDKANKQFRKAIDILKERGEKKELSRAQYHFGLMLAEKGEKNTAESHLSDALETFEEFGNELWKDKVEKQLKETV